MVLSEWLLFFRNGCEGWPYSVQREGQARSPTKSERDSAGLGGLVRIGSNPSGSRPNFFGRQHLTFDKGGKDVVRSKG